tara:strand:+ start:13395 stop:14225 length:831 start_codon:yes stop_codon:yes gene_type:complete
MSIRNSKISVCIPVYNGAKTISRCLESVITQNFKNFEIIISDNNSLDNSFNICNSYKKKHKRIKLYKQKKKISVFNNFKFLLKKAKGKYIMWIASHHQISKNFLLKNSINLDNNIDLVASMGVDYFVDNKKKEIHKQTFSFENDSYKNIKVFLRNCWRTHGLFYSLIRKEKLVKSSKYLKPYLASDWIFMLSLINNGKVCREKKAFIILGRDGTSSKKQLKHYIKKNYVSFLPYYYFNKNFIKIINSSNINMYEKFILLCQSLFLNLRYIVSTLRK